MILSRKKLINSGLLFLMATLYALWLSGLPSFLFKDRANYYKYAVNSDKLIELYESISVFVLLVREPLFLYINKFLMFLKDPELTIQIFVFFVCYSMFLFAFKTSKNLVTFLFFLMFLSFNTQTFALQLVTYRQGVCVAFLFLFLMYFKSKISYRNIFLLLMVLGFIHLSFFIVALIYLIDLVCVKYLKQKNIYFRLIVIFVIALVINIVLFQVAQMLNTKQSGGGGGTGKGGAFVLWFVTFIYIILFKPKEYETKLQNFYHKFTLMGLILYLTSYFLSPIAGRIIGTYLPFMFLTIMYKATILDKLFIGLVFLVFSYLFFTGSVENFLKVPQEILFEKMI